MKPRLRISGLIVNQDDSFILYDTKRRDIKLTGRLETERDNSGGLWLIPTQGQLAALLAAGFKVEGTK